LIDVKIISLPLFIAGFHMDEPMDGICQFSCAPATGLLAPG